MMIAARPFQVAVDSHVSVTQDVGIDRVVSMAKGIYLPSMYTIRVVINCRKMNTG